MGGMDLTLTSEHARGRDSYHTVSRPSRRVRAAAGVVSPPPSERTRLCNFVILSQGQHDSNSQSKLTAPAPVTRASAPPLSSVSSLHGWEDGPLTSLDLALMAAGARGRTHGIAGESLLKPRRCHATLARAAAPKVADRVVAAAATFVAIITCGEEWRKEDERASQLRCRWRLPLASPRSLLRLPRRSTNLPPAQSRRCSDP